MESFQTSRSSLIPSSYPPPHPRPFWAHNAPLSQTRAGAYISPEPSPTESPPLYPPPANPIFSRGYPFPPPDVSAYPGGLEAQPRFIQDLAPRAYAGATAPPHPEVDPFYNPVLMPMPRQKKTRAPKKVDGKQPTFLTKLYAVLEQPEYHHIIRWDDKGEIIIIEKPDELAAKILPAVYRQSRFASFSRQLNIYGFMRKVSLRHVEAGIIDPDASTWSHPFLRRDSPQSEIIGFKRRVPPRPSQSRRRTSIQEEVVSPSSSEGSVNDQPDAYAHHLLRDAEDEKLLIPALASIPVIPITLPMDQSSPSSDEIDYPWGDSRRFSMDAPASLVAPTLLQQSAEFKPIIKPMDLGYGDSMDFGTVSGSVVPQSAPAHAPSFYNPLRVTQGHLRTRSVQAEPPSATLFSPSSPLAAQSWLPQDEDMTTDPYPPQPAPIAPWLKRGITDMPLGDSATSFGPSSLPHDFAPKGYLTTNGGLHATLHSTSFSAALSDDSPIDPHPIRASHPFQANKAQVSTRDPAQGDGHNTIFPGIYQQGFSLPPSYRDRPPCVTSPRITPRNNGISMTKEGRRASVSSAPYSPPSRSRPPLSLGAVRGVDSRRDSSSAPDEAREGDDGLPSGGLMGIGNHPFQSVFLKPEMNDDPL